MNDFSKPQPIPAAPAAERTQWGYQNADGHRLHVSTVGADRDHVELAIAGVGDLGWRSLNIPATEAPGIALALLKAAGVTPAPYDAADSLQRALAQLEEHEGIQRNQHAAAELTKRRDALASQLTPLAATYAAALPAIQAAIDMIIQLQDETTQ